MIFKHPKFAGASTLTEVIVAMAILAIAALGGWAYQYSAARHTRIALTQIAGTRTAQLLLEDWKSAGGAENYDPTALGMGFSSLLGIPSFWSIGVGNTLHDTVYAITVDDIPMQVMLQWRDIDSDPTASVTLRELTATVRFVEDAEESEYLIPVILTTYVRLGSAGS